MYYIVEQLKVLILKLDVGMDQECSYILYRNTISVA